MMHGKQLQDPFPVSMHHDKAELTVPLPPVKNEDPNQSRGWPHRCPVTNTLRIMELEGLLVKDTRPMR